MSDQIPVAPCAGKWMLFDSQDINDHKEAAKLCAGCPIVDQCRDTLDQEITNNRSGKSGMPVGTWAGELVRDVAAERRVFGSVDVEESMFSDAEAAEAASRYRSGDRSDRSIIGYRVFQRRQKGRTPPRAVAEALEMLRFGWTIKDAAREVGMTRGALDQALCRWRRREREGTAA